MGEGDAQWRKKRFYVSRRMGVDDRQPVITLQVDLCILSTEVMWVGGEKGN